MIKKRILLRSIEQIQTDISGITDKNIDLIKKVYVSPVLDELFTYMQKNSILFELYIDDIWCDNSERSAKPKIYRGFSYEKFSSCIKYLEYLIDVEKTIRDFVKCEGTWELYIDMFSSDILCRYLLEGLENSYRIFYRREDYGDIQEKENINIKLEKCKSLLEKKLS